MSEWNDIIFIAENRTINFREDELPKANIVFPGATVLGGQPPAKRYAHYASLLPKQAVTEGLYKIDLEQISYIYDIEQYTENIFIDKLYEEVLERKEMEEWDLSYLKLSFESEREEIESELVSFLSNMEQVIKIFTIQTDDFNLHIQILTNNTKYDRDLVMKLYEIEYQIEQNHGDILLSFSHIPKIYNSENDVVIKEAKQIYKKYSQSYHYEHRLYPLTTGSAQQEIGELLVAASTV